MPAAAIGLLFCSGSFGQMPEDGLRRLIGVDRWTAKEREALDRGDAVAMPLPSSDKQEVASLGVVRIRSLPAVTMSVFRESFDQKGGGPLTAGGRFSSPAGREDLKALELDEDTFEQLRKCSIGDCDLNLPAAMIARLRAEAEAAGAEARVAETFREMLVQFVNNYTASGEKALGHYDNRRKTVDLAASHRSLLENTPMVKELAPEFVEYLAKYPAANRPEGVENTMHWSVVDFGLKPSITVSHAAAYTQRTGGIEQFFVASRQIYSSRYLDSSISFTMLLRAAAANGIDTYIVFLDRSRSDALDGPLGGLARGAVRSEAAERIRSLLDKAHLRLLAAARPGDPPPAEPSETAMQRAGRFAAKNWIPAAAAALMILAGAIFLWRRSSIG